MTMRLVEEAVAKFLSTDLPEIMCIRGKWGVGKTYSWNKFLESAGKKKAVKLPSYSYVSLFGVNSIADFRSQIFENSVPTDVPKTQPGIGTLEHRLKATLKTAGKKTWALARFFDPPYIRDFGASIGTLSTLLVKQTIICVDDFERKGPQLSAGEVLGVLSQLKETRQCKAVLILNDNALDEDADDTKQFRRYFEKVIDASLEFAPTSAESIEIALDQSGDVHDALRESCQKLEISNIRVLKRIERLVDQIQPLLAKCEPELRINTAKSIAVLGWSQFSREDAPTKEFLIHERIKHIFGSKNELELSDEKKRWNELLSKVGFLHCDEFDLTLFAGIERGFFDEMKIKDEASKLNAQYLASKAQQSLTEAWEPFHHSFDDNTAEVVTSIFNGCKANIRYLTPSGLNSAVRVLKTIGAPEKAGELIEFYIAKRSLEPKIFDLSEDPFGGDIDDEDIVKEFAAKYKATVEPGDPTEILQKIAGGGWGTRDIELLDGLSVDDFRRLFKSLRGDDLYKAVNGALQFRRVINAGAKEASVAAKAEAALKEIAKESALNRRRIQKYGVNIATE